MPGGYDIYGPRVPAIVVSPYSKPNAVTNVVHDHTSFLATVEAKWNLPALTYRDANAKTVTDFLDVEQAAFMKPPTIAEPPAPVAAADHPLRQRTRMPKPVDPQPSAAGRPRWSRRGAPMIALLLTAWGCDGPASPWMPRAPEPPRACRRSATCS